MTLARRTHYAETFVVPVVAEFYKLINLGNKRAMVVKAFIESLLIDPLP